MLFFLQFIKKILGRVLGVLFFLQFFTKILGRVPGVFSVFQCVQCVVSTDPVFSIFLKKNNGENRMTASVFCHFCLLFQCF